LVLIVAIVSIYVYSEVVRSPIGVVVRVGDWEISVVNMAQATYIKSGDSYYGAKQGYKIVLLRLRIANLGVKTESVSNIWDYVLVTDAKRSYDNVYPVSLEWILTPTEDVTRNAVSSETLDPFASVAPNTAVEGDIIFQIPMDETPIELHFKVGIFEATEAVIYLQPPYTYTLIGKTPAIITIPTTITIKETMTTTIISTIREINTITTTHTIPTTITATDWTTTGIVAVVLLVIGIAIGYIIKRK